MKKYILLCAALFCFQSNAFGFATVATTIQGGDTILFNSNMSDIDVYLNGLKVGVIYDGYFSYQIERSSQTQTFSFKKEGYQTEQIILSTKFAGLFWGNIPLSFALTPLGGSLGSSTDSWFTDNTKEYSPSQYYIELIKD